MVKNWKVIQMNRDELITELERDIQFVCTYKGERIEHIIWLLKQMYDDGTFLWPILYIDYQKVYDGLKKNLLEKMKKLTLPQSIEILESLWSTSLKEAQLINKEQGECGGSIDEPGIIKDFGTWATLSYDIKKSSTYLFDIEYMARLLEKIHKLTGWKLGGILFQDHAQLNFNNYHFLKGDKK